MIRQFWNTITWWPSLTLALLQVGLTLYALSQPPESYGQQNAWDVFLPQLSETRTLALVTFLWWALLLARQIPTVVSPERLIRVGSVLRSVTYSLVQLLPSLLAGLLLVSASTYCVASAKSNSLYWSESAHLLHDLRDEIQLSVFSPGALLAHFESPFTALIAILAWCATGYLLIAALCIAVAVRFGRVTAAVLLWTVFSAMAITTFAGSMDSFLPVSLVSLPWAIGTETFTTSIVVFFCILALTSLITMYSVSAIANYTRALFSHRVSGLVFLAIAIPLALSFPTNTSGTADRLAGRNNDLISYAVIQIILFGFTSLSVLRVRKQSTPRSVFEQRAIRYGTNGRWLRHLWLREVAWICCWIGAFLGLVALIDTSAQNDTFGPEQLPYLLLAAGSGAAALCIFSFSTTLSLIWWSSIDKTWIAICSVVLLIGYALPPAAINPGAPYSIDPGLQSINYGSILAIWLLALASSIFALLIPNRYKHPQPV